jgi:hypothetical protein
MTLFLIYYILLFSLFGGVLEILGIPQYFTVTVELAIMLLLLLSLITSKNYRLPNLWYSFSFFLLIGICSVIVNNGTLSQLVFSLRLLFRFYIFYLSITFLSLDDNRLKRIINFVAILLLLQLPVVAVKYFQYGISEKTYGAYGQAGGSLTTMLPIVVIFYFAAYYFIFQPRLRYLVVALGFILFSIVGKKRAVLFLYPVQFVAIYFFLYSKKEGIHLPKKIWGVAVAFGIAAVVSATIIHFNETLNPARKVGGEINMGYVVDYAKDYTTAESGYGLTTGRYSTTKRIFGTILKSDLAKISFGFGPGRMTSSILESKEEKKERERFLLKELRIWYGVTSLTRIAVEYGILGVFAFSLIPITLGRMCLRYYRYESDRYWKAFAAGSIGFSFSMLFFFTCYNTSAFFGDTMPALYFGAMAVVYERLNKICSPSNTNGFMSMGRV